MALILLFIATSFLQHFQAHGSVENIVSDEEIDESATVQEQAPYVAAVLKGSQYLCPAALVSASWVLTAASTLAPMHDSLRFLRVRVGSTNYKKGGELIPVKLFQIHPYYNSSKLGYDVAMINLAYSVNFGGNLRPVRLQLDSAEVTSTHFVVTSWIAMEISKNSTNIQPAQKVRRHQTITVKHLHPTNAEDCSEELMEAGVAEDVAMCLEPPDDDPCMSDAGAPVVSNSLLWAVLSPWRAAGCDRNYYGSVFGTLVSERNVSTWIHSQLQGHDWDPTEL